MENKMPTLSEVKEYFKNAETAEDWSGTRNKVTLEKLEITEHGDVIQDTLGANWLVLFYAKRGYAKILTYKNTEPKFYITKEHILKLHDMYELMKLPLFKKEIKEMFPEAFETVLEVGKWYYQDTYGKSIFKITSIEGNIVCGYGFNYEGIYKNESEWFNVNDNKGGNIRLSTTEEVTEALKNEAVNRYKKGNCINGLYMKKSGFLSFEKTASNQGFIYVDDYFSVWMNVGNGMNDKVFDNGVWAEIIPTKKIQEAEELLKELGHNFKIV